MAKSSGTTRSGSSSNPRGLGNTSTANQNLKAVSPRLSDDTLRTLTGSISVGYNELAQFRTRVQRAYEEAIEKTETAIDNAVLPKAGQSMEFTLPENKRSNDFGNKTKVEITITKDQDTQQTMPWGETVNILGDYRLNGTKRAEIGASESRLRTYLKNITREHFS